jgi:hypothetical protein
MSWMAVALFALVGMRNVAPGRPSGRLPDLLTD